MKLSPRVRKEQPICVYCGVSPSEQADHCPPKTVFTGKVRPKGLEFGICNECHQPTRAIDQIAATFSRLMPEPSTDAERADIWKYAQAMANNYPDIMQLFQGGSDTGENMVIHISGDNAARMHYAMNAFCARLAMALFQQRVGRPAGLDMRIYTTYYTAAEIHMGEVPDAIFQVMREPKTLRNGRRDAADQFLYDWYYDDEGGEYFVTFASFRQSFCPFVMIKPDLMDFEIHGNKGAVFKPGFLKGLDYRDVAQWEERRREGLKP